MTAAWIGTTIISILAFGVSLVTLWRTHLSPFRILASPGPMNFRMHIIEAKGTETRYAINFAVTLGVTNPGARIGHILGVRARVHYPELPVSPAYETLMCIGEFDPAKYLQHSNRTLEMLREAKLSDLAPFFVLPRATVTKFIVFRGFWNGRPVYQKDFRVEIECLTDQKKEWKPLGKWSFPLNRREWEELVTGSTFMSHPVDQPHDNARQPPNLEELLYQRRT